MTIRNTLASIVELFGSDSGASWSKAEREYAFIKWEALDVVSQGFLDSLSDEDLANVCIGEVRDDGNGTDIHLYRGKWQPVPPSVDKFLTDIWEYAS